MNKGSSPDVMTGLCGVGNIAYRSVFISILQPDAQKAFTIFRHHRAAFGLDTIFFDLSFFGEGAQTKDCVKDPFIIPTTISSA